MKTCTCDWLKNAANDERFPVEYDEQDNQFKLRCQLGDEKPGYTVLYFCPFCGGRAPDLKKEKIFAQISELEFERLQDIAREIQSIEDAFRILGEPEQEFSREEQRAILSAEEKELMDAARALTYQNVSETATIHVIEYKEGGVRIIIQEKFIG